MSWSRRHDWYRVTGHDGRWLIPDWQAVATDWDAVHLTVAGYLQTATRRLPVHDGARTLLAGWDPDQTWWLTDVLTSPRQEPERWNSHPSSEWDWARVPHGGAA